MRPYLYSMSFERDFLSASQHNNKQERSSVTEEKRGQKSVRREEKKRSEIELLQCYMKIEDQLVIPGFGVALVTELLNDLLLKCVARTSKTGFGTMEEENETSGIFEAPDRYFQLLEAGEVREGEQGTAQPPAGVQEHPLDLSASGSGAGTAYSGERYFPDEVLIAAMSMAERADFMLLGDIEKQNQLQIIRRERGEEQNHRYSPEWDNYEEWVQSHPGEEAERIRERRVRCWSCLLYTSDAADE